MKPLPQIKKELRQLVPVGIADVIKALKELLPDESEKYQAVLVLEGRLNETNKNRLLGVIGDEQLQVAYNRLRKDLLDLIGDLAETDFDPDLAAGPTKAGKAKQGSVLYRIPATMPLEKESKCVVRIALEKETIVRNIELDEHLQLRDIRVSDIMQVELVDPSEAHPFQIRPVNSPEQFIEAGEYTEWLFYVKPRSAGVFPLLLKVSVIELIHGKERKREIVLEEQVEIITEGAVEDARQEWQPAGYALSFAATTDLVDFQYTGTERTPPASGYRLPTALRRSALLLAALVAFTGGAWAVAPARVEWVAVRYLADNDETYDWYIARHEASPLREEAFLRKAEIQETPEKKMEVYQQYLETVEENPRFREEVKWELARLEDRPVAYLNYLREFPAAEAARKTGMEIPQLERKVLQQLESDSDTAGLDRILDLLQVLKDDQIRAGAIKKITERAAESNPAPEPARPDDPAEIKKAVEKEDPVIPPVTDPAKNAPIPQENLPDPVEKEKTPPSDEAEKTTDTPASAVNYGRATLGGKTYRTLRLSGLTWMAQNLDYPVPDSWCYDDDRARCEAYGRLYTWESAKQACREVGWRLPTDAEWRAMAQPFGGAKVDASDGGKAAYKALMADGKSGFAAQLGGSRSTAGAFYSLGGYGRYWSATERAAGLMWGYSFYDGELSRYSNDKSGGVSCRCVQD